MAGTADFRGQCGECSSKGDYNSASCAGGMQVGQSATVNGNPPQNCVVGNDKAMVESITLVANSGFYDYQIQVNGQGPNSWIGGSFYLAFEDATGDVYYLSIYSSRLEMHTVSFNSSDPRIMSIYWSDYAFTVKSDTANQQKADFQVVNSVQTANA